MQKCFPSCLRKQLILLYLFLLTDNEILRVLNNGTIKELKKLQGVGQKRAKLIADWRTVHGPFQKVNLSKNRHLFCTFSSIVV